MELLKNHLQIKIFFYRLFLVFTSFFGIGCLTKFSEIIVCLAALVLSFIPIINENIYIIDLILIALFLLLCDRIEYIFFINRLESIDSVAIQSREEYYRLLNKKYKLSNELQITACKNTGCNLVITKAIAVFIASNSVIININWLWQCIGVLFFFILHCNNLVSPQKFKFKSAAIALLGADLLKGVFASFLLHIIFWGYKLMPLVLMFFNSK